MTEQQTSNQPVETLRDGTLKATIWRNSGKKGVFFTTEISRFYTDGKGNYRDSRSMSAAQLLKQSRLALRAYDRVR